MYVVAFFVGVFGVFFNAAKMAVIPDLVQHEELLPANAALTSIGRVATVTGMVGGGLLVEWSELEDGSAGKAGKPVSTPTLSHTWFPC